MKVKKHHKTQTQTQTQIFCELNHIYKTYQKLLTKISFYSHLLFFFLFTLFASFANFSFASDTEADREKLVSAKSRKFLRSDKAKQYVIISGNRDSDHNSRSQEIDLRYLYQSKQSLHEINYLQENRYTNKGTTVGNTYLEKDRERYDILISNKFRILKDSQNYLAVYNRVDYDDLSSYYYDFRSAVGFGRSFFSDKIELDASYGYLNIKNSGSKTFLLPSIRINIPITKKITFTQRAFWFIDYESMDNEIRSTLQYRIAKNYSLTLNHIFEQRKYDDLDDRVQVNQTRKYTSIGLSINF